LDGEASFGLAAPVVVINPSAWDRQVACHSACPPYCHPVSAALARSVLEYIRLLKVVFHLLL